MEGPAFCRAPHRQKYIAPCELTSNRRPATIDGWEVSIRRALIFVLLLCIFVASTTFAQTATLGLNAPQLYEKGMNSLLGAGINRNDVNAVDYFRRSAELGYPQAQVVLGYLYETGSVVTQDSQQAADWYKKLPGRTIVWPTGWWDGSTTPAAEFRAI